MTIGTAINIYLNILSPEEYYNLESELAGLKESLQRDPVANYRVTMELTPHLKPGKINKRAIPLTKQVGLTEFINLREGCLPSEFNERQTRALSGIEHPPLNARGKVEARWALDRVARELGLEWEELVNRIEHVAKVKRRIKELEAKLRDLRDND